MAGLVLLATPLMAVALAGQAGRGDSASRALAGAIDIHVHSAPDNTPRSVDAIDAAKLARARGMRAIVLKNHYDPTGGLADIVRKEVPGIEVFGGIDLNLTVGGMNPAAVEHMTQVSGGWGRLVWMSTFDAENQVRYSKENRPFVAHVAQRRTAARSEAGDRRHREAQPGARDRTRLPGRRADARCARASGRACSAWSSRTR